MKNNVRVQHYVENIYKIALHLELHAAGLQVSI